MLRTILSIHLITKSTNQCSSIQIQRIQENPKSTVNHHTTTIVRRVPPSVYLPEHIHHHHIHTPAFNKCSSTIVQTISAPPVETIWSVVRRFDKPQTYKRFLKSCNIIIGDGDVGYVREVRVVSGLPAGSSLERLETRDDEQHVMSFSVVGGDHRLKNYRLKNYRSVTTLHSSPTCRGTTVVVESYVVDVPPENTKEETCVFVETIVRCNLMSLKHIAQSLAHK